MADRPPAEDLLRRNAELESELADAQATIEAIRTGSVDAVVVYEGKGPRIYTLEGADAAYRVLFETLNEGALTLSPQGLVLAANARFARMVDVPLEEVIGSPFRDFVSRDDAPSLDGILAKAVDGGGRAEIALRRRSGSVAVLLSAGAVLVDGRPDAIAVVATDLTELREAQDALQHAHQELEAANEELEVANEELKTSYEELERKVDERTAELRAEVAVRTRAEDALREADRRKDEFLAMLSHELRNPLAAVSGALDVLRHRCDAEDPMQVRSHAAARRQIDHLRRMLDDLLDVSRITRGKLRLHVERVLLTRVVEDAIEMARPLIEQRRHHLSVSLPPEPVELNADPTRLAQALGNLLNNAAKFTEPGGEIRLTAHRVHPSDGDAESRVAISVADSGAGIEPDLLPHVFDLFTQGRQGVDRAMGGLGLGLSLAHDLVQMHGGTIEAHSEGAGKGSEFVITLPAAAPARQEQARPAASAPRKRRILVVEDNADTAEMFSLLLEYQGHQVVVAHNGQAALRLAGEYHPDAVLLDIGLPGMDGYEVARRLRAQPETRHTLMIAVTGFGQDEDEERAYAAGFDRHLVKPVEMNELQRVLAGQGK